MGYKPVLYSPEDFRITMQDKWTWPWATAVTQYGARVTSNWWGNQLPNSSVHIAGVPDHLWKFVRPTNPMQKQYPLGAGLNIQTSGLITNANMMQNIQMAWKQGSTNK